MSVLGTMTSRTSRLPEADDGPDELDLVRVEGVLRLLDDVARLGERRSPKRGNEGADGSRGDEEGRREGPDDAHREERVRARDLARDGADDDEREERRPRADARDAPRPTTGVRAASASSQATNASATSAIASDIAYATVAELEVCSGSRDSHATTSSRPSGRRPAARRRSSADGSCSNAAMRAWRHAEASVPAAHRPTSQPIPVSAMIYERSRAPRERRITAARGTVSRSVR